MNNLLQVLNNKVKETKKELNLIETEKNKKSKEMAKTTKDEGIEKATTLAHELLSIKDKEAYHKGLLSAYDDIFTLIREAKKLYEQREIDKGEGQ